MALPASFAHDDRQNLAREQAPLRDIQVVCDRGVPNVGIGVQPDCSAPRPVDEEDVAVERRQADEVGAVLDQRGKLQSRRPYLFALDPDARAPRRVSSLLTQSS